MKNKNKCLRTKIEENDKIKPHEIQNNIDKKKEKIIKNSKNIINREYKYSKFNYENIEFSYPYFIIKNNYIIIFQKIIILFLFLFINKYKFSFKDNNNIEEDNIIRINITLPKKINRFKYYKYGQFAILSRNCYGCGLFSFYIVFLGCVNNYIKKGYIPIIDLKLYPNVYNNYSISYKNNPWESFFEQPFGYSLEETLKYAKHIKYFICKQGNSTPSALRIYYNRNLINFWHDFSYKYLPIKKEIIKETNILMKNLFNNSKNVLGVKIRGTDHYSQKPKNHPIPPKLDDVIRDVKNMTIKNNNDWIFIASEDERIKERFIKEFEGKIKYLNPKKKINFDYNGKQLFANHKDVVGNFDYAKNYIMNIYILSKCTDIIISRGCGGAVIILLTNGFRNSLIYNLGEY